MIWHRFLALALCAPLLAAAVAGPAAAQRDRDHGWERPRAEDIGTGDARDPDDWANRWQLLGTETVGFRAETDTIRVGRDVGRYSNIALVVRRGEVYVHGLRVLFLNGESQDIRIRERYSAGGRTGPLDLTGDARVIDRIELMYKAVEGGHRGGPAVVEIWGDKAGEHRHHHEMSVAPPPPPPQQWVQLGCQKVGFLEDHDVLRVGRDAGRFTAIKLAVSGTKVFVRRMRVIYANGEPDNLPVDAEIHSGAESAVLDLHGDRRAIDRIELDYGSKPSFKGEATACVLGLLDRPR